MPMKTPSTQWGGKNNTNLPHWGRNTNTTMKLTELIADFIGALIIFGGFFAFYYVFVPSY
jgi:hypothetical protein